MEILYSDPEIVVCVKPVGMDSEHEVPQALGGEIYPIHRLAGIILHGLSILLMRIPS